MNDPNALTPLQRRTLIRIRRDFLDGAFNQIDVGANVRTMDGLAMRGLITADYSDMFGARHAPGFYVKYKLTDKGKRYDLEALDEQNSRSGG